MVRITLDKPYIPIPVPAVITAVKYGLLYNWYAVTDARNICADGWKMPEQSDFNTLSTYLGGNTVSGGKMKETGIIHWSSTNSTGSNTSKYNGRGAASRDTAGDYIGLKDSCSFWTLDERDSNNAYHRGLYYSIANLAVSFTPKKAAISLRLIKTTTILSDGDEGIYIGNDGKVYRTICIGTQEWLADNLAETKYRNGDTIPEVTDNSAWAALTTGALCAYNNDWSNVLI